MRHQLLILCLLLGGCSMGPKTFTGDKVESRTCRWCNGSGQNTEPEGEGGPVRGGACPGCGGSKTVQVIVPGPKHPALVKGTVRDIAKAPAADDGLTAMMEAREPMKPITGGISGAKASFQKDGSTQEISSASSGRFKILLEPGHYQVHVTADGFADLDTELDVAPRKEPIWQERAHLKTEAAEADTSYFDAALKAR
ncbi:carboxypeptidase regulatory-like domain-containing protein [bacterium]|nr:carboxypeptidase regulatory-like domain-containing protein [bacterium]